MSWANSEVRLIGEASAVAHGRYFRWTGTSVFKASFLGMACNPPCFMEPHAWKYLVWGHLEILNNVTFEPVSCKARWSTYVNRGDGRTTSFSHSLLKAPEARRSGAPTMCDSPVRLGESESECVIMSEWQRPQPQEPYFPLEPEFPLNTEGRQCRSKKHERRETLLYPFLLLRTELCPPKLICGSPNPQYYRM